MNYKLTTLELAPPAIISAYHADVDSWYTVSAGMFANVTVLLKLVIVVENSITWSFL